MRGKIFIALGFLLGLVYSLYQLKNTVPVFKAEAVISVSGSSSSRTIDPDKGLLSLFGDSFSSSTDYAQLASKMLGSEFLGALIAKNPSIIADGCEYSRPSVYSVKGMLDLFGVFPIKPLDKKQLSEVKIECLRNIIEINDFKYDKLSTKSFSIFVKSADPLYAAEVANIIVDHYFLWEQSKAKMLFEKELSYFSDKIGETQLEKETYGLELDNFIINNPGFASDIEISDDFLLSGIGEIRKLRANEALLINAIEYLATAFNSRNYSTIKFNKSVDFQTLYSDTFVFEIEKLLSQGTIDKTSTDKANTLIDTEIGKLNAILQNVKIRLDQKEKEAEESAVARKKYNQIKLDYLSKSAYLEELKASANMLQTEEAFLGFKNFELQSAASPPINHYYPNERNTMIFGSLVGLVLATIAVLIRQLLSRKIFNINQATHVCKSEMIYLGSSLSQLRNISKRYITIKSVAIHRSFMEICEKLNSGEKIAVIDLSENTFVLPSTMASEVMSALVSYLGKFDKKVVQFFDFSEKRNLVTETGEGLVKEYFNDKDSMASDVNRIMLLQEEDYNNLSSVLNKEPSYDNYVFSLNSNCADHKKLKVLQSCDKLILLGKAGRLSEKVLRDFLFAFDKEKEKCLGLILID